ncbi:MAG: hypothetical protein PHY31_02265, partial [Smithellaceae bacterium]|nr:hypothetical protein [Smithellaceae bacterium]
MKKILLIAAVMGMFLSLCGTASAVDIKFSGSYFVAGIYEENHSLTDPRLLPSTAFYFQRVRLQTEFRVSDKLWLTTRFDALDRTWGSNTAQETNGAGNTITSGSGNIQWDHAYITYVSPIGFVRAGYQEHGVWGTSFGDTSGTSAKIVWAVPAGEKLFFVLQVEKLGESSYPYTTAPDVSPQTITVGTQSDLDVDAYYATVFYKGDDLQAGLQYYYTRDAYPRSIPNAGSFVPYMPNLPMAGDYYYPFTAVYHTLDPFFKLRMGSVNVEGEIIYQTGAYKYD